MHKMCFATAPTSLAAVELQHGFPEGLDVYVNSNTTTFSSKREAPRREADVGTQASRREVGANHGAQSAKLGLHAQREAGDPFLVVTALLSPLPARSKRKAHCAQAKLEHDLNNERGKDARARSLDVDNVPPLTSVRHEDASNLEFVVTPDPEDPIRELAGVVKPHHKTFMNSQSCSKPRATS